jgi:hypothetical protein
LKEREEISITKKGKIRISFSEGKNIIIKQDGQQSKINKEGAGWTFID